MAGVAQLVRASGCGPEGRGFESHHSPHKKYIQFKYHMNVQTSARDHQCLTDEADSLLDSKLDSDVVAGLRPAVKEAAISILSGWAE